GTDGVADRASRRYRVVARPPHLLDESVLCGRFASRPARVRCPAGRGEIRRIGDRRDARVLSARGGPDARYLGGGYRGRSVRGRKGARYFEAAARLACLQYGDLWREGRGRDSGTDGVRRHWRYRITGWICG